MSRSSVFFFQVIDLRGILSIESLSTAPPLASARPASQGRSKYLFALLLSCLCVQNIFSVRARSMSTGVPPLLQSPRHTHTITNRVGKHLGISRDSVGKWSGNHAELIAI